MTYALRPAVPADAAAAARLVNEHALLMVVGATRHRALSAAVLGSTSNALCSEAPCPVVVVPGGAGDPPDGSG